MLELHRASAGSGKTYTLAKKYIWYFITIRNDDGKRRLRTDAELADSARRILAVTFTNKATGEMQMRIVKRVFDLAYMAPRYKQRKSGQRYIKSPEYLEEFTAELGESPQRVAAVCRKGLALLLEHYSDFNVSTIDSFFQLVLRTLAYESDLRDSYQVEMDSDFLSQTAVDAVIEDLDLRSEEAHDYYWVKELIYRAESKKGWNIFSRTPSKAGNEYTSFLKSVNSLNNEDYKMKRNEVEAYLRKNVDLIKLYNDLKEKYDLPIREAFDGFRNACADFVSLLPEIFFEQTSNSDPGILANNANKLTTWKIEQRYGNKDLSETYRKVAARVAKLGSRNSLTKFMSGFPGLADNLRNAFDIIQDKWQKWSELVDSPESRHWKVYESTMPYFALFSDVTRKRLEYLDELNAIELGETNSILSAIIGDSDAPFVYERLGTVLNHFLIDEFQDTSRMQWENLRPLLEECLTRDDSLIIGDAKQSIYRFRNADPSLITEVVPSNFGDKVKSFGNTRAENANYRSCLRVVQFNNSFFDFLVSRLDESSAPSRRKFSGLYSNVVQVPKKEKDRGYVEATVVSKKEHSNYVLSRVPQLVQELLKRGFEQKDIAVLVSKNQQGEDIINSFVDYNANLGEGEREIRFISEESLKVENSRAVKLIVGVLNNMVRGMDPKINEGEALDKYGIGKWDDFATNFKFFAMDRGGKSVSQLLEEFLEARPDMNEVTGMLGSLQSMAIPAIVEAVVARFIPEDLRRDDAIFISAFQDNVLEYCESNPTDIGSFMKWWERRKKSASVTSPAGTDAVQVMTIHKSKGLEFPCVIVPFADWDFADSLNDRPEWRWVVPSHISHESIEMPPYLPVLTTEQLCNTAHEDIFYQTLDFKKMDSLNTAYVAFTRAAQELYLFSPDSKLFPANLAQSDIANELVNTSRYIADFVIAAPNLNPDSDLARIVPSLVNVELPVDSVVKMVLTYGEQEPDIKAMRLADKEAEDPEDREEEKPEQMATLEDYCSCIPDINTLKFDAEDSSTERGEAEASADVETAETGLDDDLDPRSEGNLKHAVLEMVRVPEDLHSAVRHVMLSGLMTRSRAEQIQEELAVALARKEVQPWFDGTSEVINERSILCKDPDRNKSFAPKRPDRMLLHPDGSVTVIDYKFGKIDKSGKYVRQVRRYMKLLAATGKFVKIRGFLWYVNENEIRQI